MGVQLFTPSPGPGSLFQARMDTPEKAITPDDSLRHMASSKKASYIGMPFLMQNSKNASRRRSAIGRKSSKEPLIK